MKPVMALILFLATMGAVGAQTPTQAPAQAPYKLVEQLDPALEQIVSADAVLETVFPGTGFLEGPTWVPGRPGYLIFTDIPKNIINKLGPDGKVSVVVDNVHADPDRVALFDTGVNGRQKLTGPDGSAVDRQGRITYCEFSGGRVIRVENNGTRTVLADRFEGHRFNSPNDLVYKSDGSLYFTDSGADTTRPDNDPNKGVPHRGVYRVKDGKLELMSKDFSPNGIAFSPDEKYLYITQAMRKLVRFDVQLDGTLTNGHVFFDLDVDKRAGGPDGLKTDKDGNVYSTGPAGIWIISPAGKHIGTLVAPVQRFVNFTFGGDDGKSLYIAAPEALYRVALKSSRVR